MNLKMYEDRISINKLNKSAIQVLEQYGLVDRQISDKVYFCGVLFLNKEILVFAPRGTQRSLLNAAATPVEVASLILQVLAKYQSSSASQVHDGDGELSQINVGVGMLGAILYLLNDYVQNGLYVTQQRVREYDVGTINWNRTIVCETPLPGIGGYPIYTRLHVDRNRTDHLSAISLLHANTIRKLDEMFCWIVSGDVSIRLARDLDFTPQQNISRDKKIMLVRNELDRVFSDRATRVMRALLTVFESEYMDFTKECVIGTKLFHGVWEEMLRCILPNVIPAKNILPRPIVFLRDEEDGKHVRGMITDILLRKGDHMSVVDAKYYGARGHDDIPGWHDLVKQFFYAKAIQGALPDCTVSNWLAFPGLEKAIDAGPVKSISVSDSENGVIMVEDFPPIGCSYFCPIDVMRYYSVSKRLKSNAVSQLFEQASIA